jgi:hypothetical protein
MCSSGTRIARPHAHAYPATPHNRALHIAFPHRIENRGDTAGSLDEEPAAEGHAWIQREARGVRAAVAGKV